MATASAVPGDSAVHGMGRFVIGVASGEARGVALAGSAGATDELAYRSGFSSMTADAVVPVGLAVRACLPRMDRMAPGFRVIGMERTIGTSFPGRYRQPVNK